VDFSNVFDTIDHVILLAKLKRLTLANNVLNWVTDFLTVGDKMSSPAQINLSIIQGSGIGPTLYQTPEERSDPNQHLQPSH